MMALENSENTQINCETSRRCLHGKGLPCSFKCNGFSNLIWYMYQTDIFGVGFLATDNTFENIAGLEKHQAVALKISSDQSVFYRCSFKAYQDTLYVHSNRQFYRDCHIYGTIDFIFRDAVVVLQNCEIFVRKPMRHQSNFIIA